MTSAIANAFECRSPRCAGARRSRSGRSRFGLVPAAILGLLLTMTLPSAALSAEATAGPEKREATSTMPAGVIELDETVISGNQELPKVLYIVPWQQPDGLPDIELSTQFEEVELFRRLYPPAYRRELSYFEAASGDAEPSDSTSDSKE